MLTPLPTTDLFSHPPDVEGLDILGPDFKLSEVPSRTGCYAFYRRDTGEVVYIGSTVMMGPDVSSVGLRYRMRIYRGRGPKERVSSTTEKVRNEHAVHPLLMRGWFCDNPGDTRKYEDDAIRRHRPLLNFIGSRDWTLEAAKAWRLKRSGMWAAKPKDYDPERVVTCRVCKVSKPSKDMERTKYAKAGVRTRCKICKMVQERDRSRRARARRKEGK